MWVWFLLVKCHLSTNLMIQLGCHNIHCPWSVTIPLLKIETDINNFSMYENVLNLSLNNHLTLQFSYNNISFCWMNETCCLRLLRGQGRKGRVFFFLLLHLPISLFQFLINKHRVEERELFQWTLCSIKDRKEAVIVLHDRSNKVITTPWQQTYFDIRTNLYH